MLARITHPIGEWVNRLWFIHTMEYYSTIKKCEPSNHEKTWKNTLLSERSQHEKAAYYLIAAIGHCGKGEAVESD